MEQLYRVTLRGEATEFEIYLKAASIEEAVNQGLRNYDYSFAVVGCDQVLECFNPPEQESE